MNFEEQKVALTPKGHFPTVTSGMAEEDNDEGEPP